MVDFFEEESGFQFNQPPREIEYESDFESIGEVGPDATIRQRPDAFAFSHKRAYSFGPVALSDASQGLLARPWYVRVEGGDVFLSPADLVVPEEILLFSFDDSVGPIVELDLAFNQNGEVTVAAERLIAGVQRVWIYFFDSTPGVLEWVFQEFDNGRQARVLLDDPSDVTESDVMVFYVSDSENAVCYRQQRDRFDIRYITPLVGVGNLYLEDVARAREPRIVLLFSLRNVPLGQYLAGSPFASTLYPIRVTPDAMRVLGRPISGELRDIFIDFELNTPDEMRITAMPVDGGTLVDPLIDYDTAFHEMIVVGSPVSGDLRDLIIIYGPIVDQYITIRGEPRSGTLDQIVIDVGPELDIRNEPEGISIEGRPISGQLITV